MDPQSDSPLCVSSFSNWSCFMYVRNFEWKHRNRNFHKNSVISPSAEISNQKQVAYSENCSPCNGLKLIAFSWMLWIRHESPKQTLPLPQKMKFCQVQNSVNFPSFFNHLISTPILSNTPKLIWSQKFRTYGQHILWRSLANLDIRLRVSRETQFEKKGDQHHV